MNRCDIIIPIYNAFDCLKECIDSVLKNTDFKKAHLILIDDKSPDLRVFPLLKEYEKNNKQKITVLANKKNQGFIATVNKGMRYSKNDVLLLNSDAVVSKDWLNKMMACGAKDEKIATVTPLANNVTPISLPESFRKKGFPDGYTFEKMAELVEKCSMHLYPEIPSAHGFCMYIKREVINKVGYFDEKTFGKGYGEENDFCFRCLEYGYYHVLCDDTFVLHKGSQSFLEAAEYHDDELRKKHPYIRAKVDYWYEKGDLKKIVDNVVLGIGVQDVRINVLFIVQNKIADELLDLINQLVEDYNIHVLEQHDGYYTVHSFFEKVDLVTAIYERPVACYGDGRNFGEYKRMIEDIKKVFSISVVKELGEIDRKAIIEDCKKHGKRRKLNYEIILNKVLEYDFALGVVKGTMMEGMDARIEQKIREEKDREWRASLTIPQRIYLKLRYILIGR